MCTLTIEFRTTNVHTERPHMQKATVIKVHEKYTNKNLKEKLGKYSASLIW